MKKKITTLSVSEQFQNQISKSSKEAKMDSPNTHIHDRTLSWLGTCTSITSGGVQLDDRDLVMMEEKHSCFHSDVVDKADFQNTLIRDLSLGTGISMIQIVAEVKLVLWVHTSPLSEMMRSYKCFPHVSKMQTFA